MIIIGEKGHKVGDEVLMTEVCTYDEFEISNKLPDKEILDKLVDDLIGDYPKDSFDDENIEIVKMVWKHGFKDGFKYEDNKEV